MASLVAMASRRVSSITAYGQNSCARLLTPALLLQMLLKLNPNLSQTPFANAEMRTVQLCEMSPGKSGDKFTGFTAVKDWDTNQGATKEEL